MDQSENLSAAPCLSGLCETCRNLGKVSPNTITRFGTLDDIKSRAPCKICQIAALAINNYRENRPSETQDRRNEFFSVSPHGSLGSRTHGDHCICHSRFRIDLSFDRPPKSLGVISHISEDLLAVAEKHDKHLESATRGSGQGAEYAEEDSKIDIPLISSWLRKCEMEHDLCNDSSGIATRTRSHLLLVDVEDMCLVEVDPSRYFALSYVWGAAVMFKTVRSNLGLLKQQGSIKQLGDKLPLLIRDAISVVRQLEERYLWVDTLCVVQDDDKSKHDLIKMMDIIYSKAVCTIIAHGSKDASFPLPGIRSNTQRPRRIRISADTGPHKHYFVFSPYHYTGDITAYDTRGWTFQEQVLSRRRLIFASDQVFFSCHSQTGGDWCEDSLTNLGDARVEYPINLLLGTKGETLATINRLNVDCCKDALTDLVDNRRAQTAILNLSRSDSRPRDDYERIKTLIYTYTSAVTFYSSRKLSFASDILNAFAGIMAALDQAFGLSQISSVYGLLTQHLIHNLHWIPKMAVRRPGWPSWSWIGWDSHINWLDREDQLKLDFQIKDIYFVNYGNIKLISDNQSGSNAALPPPVTNQVLSTIPDISPDHQAKLLSASLKLPLLGFWATIPVAGGLMFRFHPIRTASLRIHAKDGDMCGHVHGQFDYSSSRPTDEVLSRCRLVYISHTARRCAYHIYSDCECGGGCNALVVDPGDSQEGYGTRIGLAEICRASWNRISTTREFIALA